MRTRVRSARACGADPMRQARRRGSRAETTNRGRLPSPAGLEETCERPATSCERGDRLDAPTAAPDEPVALELGQTRREVGCPRDRDDLRDLATPLRDADAAPSLHAPEN